MKIMQFTDFIKTNHVNQHPMANISEETPHIHFMNKRPFPNTLLILNYVKNYIVYNRCNGYYAPHHTKMFAVDTKFLDNLDHYTRNHP